MKALVLLTASALALAACAGGDDSALPSRTVSEINVSTDLPAIGNSGAVAYWQTLNADLETALAAEFVNSLSPDGAVMTVDVDELSLANAYSSQFQGENSTLSGRVSLAAPGSGQDISAYDVVATASQAASFLPEGTTSIAPDSPDFYQAVVRAFARGVYDAVSATATASGS